MKRLKNALLFGFLCLAFSSCQQQEVQSSSNKQLFLSIRPEDSGIDFQNQLVESESLNYYKYMYTYIGGGVGTADFDQDGQTDLFFVSNTHDHALYLNQGDLTFKNITVQAGIPPSKSFTSGVSIVDINTDGYPDIYLSCGGWDDSDNRFANQLFINNGPDKNTGLISFTEKAADYGIADDNRSINSTFFDYDRDGDLDLYVSNSPDFEDKSETVLDLKAMETDPRTNAWKGSDKLYQNDGNGHFTDVSAQAGIRPDIGFGLNAQVGDLNQDGWPDIYVCNDFRIPDFIYLNQQDGTFREARNETVKHMSFNSMGSDIADINNDGLPDIYSLDMNPEDYFRSKTTMAMTSIDMFTQMVDKNYHHQYMHNMLQINNGNGTFREVAQLAGVGNTDWSWSSLLADFDLNGYNDIFVTNGVFRDVIDRDKNNEILELLRQKKRKPTDADFLEYAQMLPQQKLTNYFFKNNGQLHFEDVSTTWTDSTATFSNGAVYADLDNDGDLEVIVSNINEPATILKNQAVEQKRGQFLQIELEGAPQNPAGTGAKVELSLPDGQILSRHQIPARGFLSSVSSVLHFGLPATETSARLTIEWPDGKQQEMQQVSFNQRLQLRYADAITPQKEVTPQAAPLFVKKSFPFRHNDPAYNDFEQQILLPHKYSQMGPAAATADVNGDGLDDIYLGGGHQQAAQLLLGKTDGTFSPVKNPIFERHSAFEDISACFLDIDQDGDQDLYVLSGSYEFAIESELQADRLYLNDGQGRFSDGSDRIPAVTAAGGVVVAADYDSDGDQDLFVGGRVVPGRYPVAPPSYLLVNEGGRFADHTVEKAPQLTAPGMITDARWLDFDGDQDMDLLLAGEWMGIQVYLNEQGKLSPGDHYPVLANTTGWWNKIVPADIDADGDIDLIAGNLGLNYKFHASPEKPFHVYTNDYDMNGTVDIILAKYYKDRQVPVRGKTCTSQQLPHLQQRIKSYREFASSDLEDILGNGLQSALHYQVTEFRSGIFHNDGNGRFRFEPFGNEAQQAPVNGVLFADLDGDQQKDLLLSGNNHMSEVETTRADAGIGVFLKGQKTGTFKSINHLSSGFFSDKDARNVLLLNAGKEQATIVVINNNGQHDFFQYN